MSQSTKQEDSKDVLALASKAGIYWVSNNTAYVHGGMLTKFLQLGTAKLRRKLAAKKRSKEVE